MRGTSLVLSGLVAVALATAARAQPSEGACGGVIITEIMYNPSTAQGPDSTDEWVEIFNAGCDPVDLTGWTFEDLLSQDPIFAKAIYPMDDGSAVLPPRAYALIIDGEGSEVLNNPVWDIPPGTRIFGTDDMALGNGLNNSPETVAIRDNQGNLVDRVMYETTDSSGCGNEANGNGYSLERVDTFGPGDCTNFRSMELLAGNFPTGGTPGSENFLWLGSECVCFGVPSMSGWGLVVLATLLFALGAVPLSRKRSDRVRNARLPSRF
jgi:hypothetical protein